MPPITQQQAKEFLNNITEKDNIAIIHHDDTDGFVSGILYHDWCKNKSAKVQQFTYTIHKTKLKDLNLKKFNKLIICDLASGFMAEELESIKNKEIFYTDHHPKEKQLPKEILDLTTSNQGYIPSSRTAYELTKQKKWLALIGTISDAADLYKENDKFINDFLEEENTTLEEFKTNYSHIFSNTITYFANTPDKIFPVLAKINSLQEIQKLKKYSDKVEKEIQKQTKQCDSKKEKIGNINIYYLEPKYQIKGIIAAIIGKKNTKEAHIFLSPKNSNKKILGISARYQSPNADLPKLLKAATKNLENVRSGGHLRASGGQIQTKDLEKFKQNIKDYISK